MEKSNNPVNPQPERLKEIIREAQEGEGAAPVDFSNTEIAFSYKSDKALKKAAWLFGLMNKHWLVGIGSKIGVAAVRMHLPFVEGIVKNTIFEQFCGGTTLLESQPRIDELHRHNVLTILDYGAEAKEKETELNNSMNETIRAIEFASNNKSVPIVSSKVSGLAPNEVLAKASRNEELSEWENDQYKHLVKRMDSICHVAAQKGVGLYFDAEETAIQPAIDRLVYRMMQRYNRDQAIVFNTYQLYRTDGLSMLKEAYQEARDEGYFLGAKLVRGAYMDQEREWAAEEGRPSPIQPNKEATDRDYNQAVRFCVERYEHIASCNASHNQESNLLQAELIARYNIPRDHPHLMFCQLLGMSDQLTFNLARAGYTVAKYVPYGPVRNVVPYLIRRAQENSSVSGDMSREYKIVMQEIKRRGLKV